MENRENETCQIFVEFMTGELSEVQRKRFEHHLETCPTCREDAAEWSLVWERLSDEATMVDPPADLKQEVMGAIFASSGETQEIRTLANAGRWGRPLRWIALAAALILAFVAGSWWKELQPNSDPSALPALMPPSQIEKLYTLKPVADNPSYTAARSAYGVACLLQSEGGRRLVVYTFGSVKSAGQSVYQVWLSKDGKRTSAGTFTVDSSGIGLLTIPWTESSPAFDKVGITLEPDHRSVSPRGRKVFDSV